MTNTLCAMCILQRVSTPIPDILLEIQSCMHQEENRCDASTGLSRIVSLIPLASIHDRDSIFRMIDVVEAGTSNAAASLYQALFPFQVCIKLALHCRLRILSIGDDRVHAWGRVREVAAPIICGLPNTATAVCATAGSRACSSPAHGGCRRPELGDGVRSECTGRGCRRPVPPFSRWHAH